MIHRSLFVLGGLLSTLVTACGPGPVEPAYQPPLADYEVNYNIYALDYSDPEWDSLNVKIHLGIEKYTQGQPNEVLFDSILDWRPVRDIPKLEEAIKIQKIYKGIDENKQYLNCGYVIYLSGRVNSRPYTRTEAEGRVMNSSKIFLDVNF